MIVSVGSYEKKKKVTEVKTVKDFFSWFDKWIVEQERQGKTKHWYTRINFCDGFWELDYGSYSSFIYVTDLPDNWREQLDKVQAGRK